MATAYIDTRKEVGINNVPAVVDTSTTTNHVRVSWDTGLRREELSRTLQEIALAVLDEESVKFPNSKFNA